MTTTRATRSRAADEYNQPFNFQLEKKEQGVFSSTFGFRNISKGILCSWSSPCLCNIKVKSWKQNSSELRQLLHCMVHIVTFNSTITLLHWIVQLLYSQILEIKLRQMTSIATLHDTYCYIQFNNYIVTFNCTVIVQSNLGNKTQANDFNCWLTEHKAHKGI